MYSFLNLMILEWIDNKINQNFTAPFFVYPMKDEKYNVVNLGTSHGEVSFDWINYSHESIQGLNLGLSGKPFKFNAYLLDYYNDFIDDDALIILPISFHSFCMRQDSYPPVESLYGTKIPLLGMVRLNNLWDLRSYPRDYPDDNFSNNFIEFSIKPTECDEKILNESLNYIREIAKSWPNLVFITTPYYYKALSDIDNFNYFYQTIENLRVELNLSYYDYSRDIRFEDESLFYNVTHLNTKGRLKFTEIIILEIVFKKY